MIRRLGGRAGSGENPPAEHDGGTEDAAVVPGESVPVQPAAAPRATLESALPTESSQKQPMPHQKQNSTLTDSKPAKVSKTSPLPDPYTPGHGHDGYRVKHYDLELDIRLASNRLMGIARITGTARAKAASLIFDLAGLKVTKVALDGARVQKFAQRGDELVITPRQPLAKDQDFAMEIRYEGNPRPRRGLWGEVGWEELEDGVLVAGQPDGAPTWFPCNDHPSQKASYRFTISTDADYRVVCNGKLTDHSRKSSRETWVYEQPEPMASYLATLQIGRYVLQPVAGNATEVVINVAAPPMLNRQAHEGLSRQRDMMDTFENLYGPYPYGEYTVVVTEDELDIPLEAQSLSIIGRNHISKDWEAQRLVAHELSHQWFGNALTVRQWKDIWLHEGFACFSEWVWSEASDTMSITERARAAYRRLLASPQDLLIGDPGPKDMFDDRVYKRGALALFALYTALGREAFGTLIQAWVKKNRHGNVSTEDFLSFVQARVEDLDVRELLNPWLYETALPSFPGLRRWAH